MRRAVLGMLLLTLSLLSVSPAAASTWAVSIAGSAGGTPFQVGFQVRLADPVGGARVMAAGVGIDVNHTADAFGLAVNLIVTAAGCTTTINVIGSGPVETSPTGSVLAAFPISGNKNVACSQPVIFTTETPPTTGGTSRSQDSPVSGEVIATNTTGTPNGTLEFRSGSVTFTTPIGQQNVSDGGVIPPGTEIQTGSDGRVTVALQDGARIAVNPDSRVTVSGPPPATTGEGNVNVASGRIDVLTSGGPSQRVYGTATVRARDRGTDFSLRYSQAGLIGSTLITVRSGIVEVENRRNQLTTLLAGQEAAFDDAVPRVVLIFPADQTPLLAGRLNTFRWTSFAGAMNYLVEFSVSPTGFARPNSTTVETPNLTARLPLGSFTEGSGIVSFSFPVPTGVVAPGTRVQYRVFPADASGQVLPGATASDASTVVVQ